MVDADTALNALGNSLGEVEENTLASQIAGDISGAANSISLKYQKREVGIDPNEHQAMAVIVTEEGCGCVYAYFYSDYETANIEFKSWNVARIIYELPANEGPKEKAAGGSSCARNTIRKGMLMMMQKALQKLSSPPSPPPRKKQKVQH